MDKFRIKELHIKKFNSKRYRGVSHTTLTDNLLIYGEHKSGKSTTLDAIAYSIFGTNGSTRAINNLAETHVRIANNVLDLSIKRKAGSSHELIITNLETKEIEKIGDINKISEKLCDVFNLPSPDFLEFKAKILYQDQDSSIKKHDYKKLLRIISYYTGLSQNNNERENLESQIKSLNEDIEYISISLKDVKNDLSSSKNVVFSSKKYIENLQQLVISYDNGTMNSVYSIKIKQKEIWADIKNLQSRNIHLQQEKDKCYNQKNSLNKFHNEKTISIVKEVVSVLICPVCGKRAKLSKVENKYNLKKCPYCGDEDYDEQLYSNIANKIKMSDDTLPLLEKKITEIEKELSDNYSELDKLKKSLKSSSSSSLIKNPHIIRTVDKFSSFADDDLKKSIDDKRQELLKFKNDLSIEEDKISSLNETISNEEKLIEINKKNIKVLEESKSKLEQKIKDESISVFLKKVNEYYNKLMDYKSQPIVFENGKLAFKIAFKNKVRELDYISSSKDIGESEKKCIDAALLFAFVDLDNENNSSLMDFVILDDPADGLYDAEELPIEAHNKANLLRLIRGKSDNNDAQFIVLTADSSYKEILDYPMEHINFNTDLFGF